MSAINVARRRKHKNILRQGQNVNSVLVMFVKHCLYNLNQKRLQEKYGNNLYKID